MVSVMLQIRVTIEILARMEGKEKFLVTVQDKKSSGAMTLDFTLNTVSVSFKIDTGAAWSLINMATYHKIAPSSQLPLQKSC